MKASIVFATGLMLAAGAVLGATNIAQAGAGGSTGSISAEFGAGNALKATAGAVSVGKAGSITTATGNTSEITASSVGYAGGLTVTGFNTTGVTYTVAEDNTLGTAQGNKFDGSFKSNTTLIGPNTGVSLK